MSNDGDDFEEIKKAEKLSQTSLMKKMIIFSVSLLLITGIAYYFIEIKDSDNDIELTDIELHQENTTEIDNDIWMPKDPDRCEKIIGLSTQMINLNNGTKDISLWSENHQEVILSIEEDYLKNCIPTEYDMMIKVPKCTITYIKIQRLIDRMDENQKDSLIESEQLEYDKLYQYYFGNYCNKVQNLIEEQPSFQEFNATR